MNARTRSRMPERLGRWGGRACRSYARCEASALHWLHLKGVPLLLASAFLWIIKLTVLGVLLYAVFWIAVLLLGVVAAAFLLKSVDGVEEAQWGVGNIEDHRQSIFYHPASHNDDPDPRFEDD